MSGTTRMLCLIATATALVSPLHATAEQAFPTYDLKVQIRPADGTLSGTGTLTLPTAAEPLTTLRFGLSELMTEFEAELVRPDNRPEPLRLSVGGTSGRITIWQADLAAPIPAKTTPQIRLRWSGGGTLPNFRISRDGSFAFGRIVPWYPQVDATGKHVGTIEYDAPDGIVIATGRRRESVAGRHVTYTITVPSSFNFAAGQYEVHESNGPVRVASYLFRRRGNDAALVAGARSILMSLERLLGRFPYEDYSIVELPEEYAASGSLASTVEGMTVVHTRLVTDPLNPATGLNLALYAHEIAHSWFGNLIRKAGTAGGTFLTEGFSEYAAYHVVREIDGERQATQYRTSGYPGNDVERQSVQAYLKLVGTDLDQAILMPPTYPSAHVIGVVKGFMVLEMLRHEVGDDRFRRALLDYVSRHALQQVSLATFRASFEQSVGQDLSWFFDQWLDRPGVPAIASRWRRDGNGIVVHVEQQRPEYRLRLPITLVGDTCRQDADIQVDRAIVEEKFTLPCRLRGVEVDPGRRVLRR